MKYHYAAISLAGSLLLASSASAQVKIGVNISLTGPAASLGIAAKNAIEILPTEIAGQKIEYIILDDASDPTIATRNTRKLIDENGVDLVIGSSITPPSLAMLEVVGPAQRPMISLAGAQQIIVPQEGNRKWAFKIAPNDAIWAHWIFDHMQSKGVKTLAIFSVANAFGESLADVTQKLATERGFKVVATEKYNAADTSVTPQVLNIMAEKPDAVFFAVFGTPGATPVIELRNRGYNGIYYLNPAIANPDFLRIAGKSANGALLPVSPVLVAEQLPDSNPTKKVALNFIDKYDAKYGTQNRSLFSAMAWDAYLLLEKAMPAALQKGKPGTSEFRVALRDSLEGVKDVIGTQGVFNMTPQDHSGTDRRAAVMVQIRDGKWIYVPEQK
jgi:branched-chain amino acid transport system substrate-binding protein